MRPNWLRSLSNRPPAGRDRLRVLELEPRCTPAKLDITPLVALDEGNAAFTTFTFTVTLSDVQPAEVGKTVTVDVATSDGTAVQPGDYLTETDTLSFLAGTDASKTFDVKANGNTVVQPDRSFTAKLSNATNAVINSDTGTGTIRDDDTTTVTVTGAAVDEGGTLTFTLTSSNAVAGGFAVDVAAVGGTAQAGTNFTPAGQTFTFAGTAGETKSFVVSSIADGVVTPDRQFTAALSNNNATDPGVPDGKVVLGPAGTGTVRNTDTTTLTITGGAAPETGGPITFTVTSSRGVSDDFTVSYATQDGAGGTGAVAGANYTAAAGAVAFSNTKAGDSRTFTVAVQPDNKVTPSLLFAAGPGVVTVAGNAIPTSRFVLGPAATGTVLNTDKSLLTVSSPTGPEGGGSLTFVVTSPTFVQGGFEVDFATADGTAVAGTNYTATASPPRLAFAGTAGETRTVVVPVRSDGLVTTTDKQFTLSLVPPAVPLGGAAAGDVVATATGTGTVTNTDAATVSVSTSALDESNNLTFAVTLSAPVDQPVTVTLTANGTSRTAAVNTVVTFPANAAPAQRTVLVVVPTADDRRVLGTEAVVPALSNLSAGGRPVTVGLRLAGGVLDNDSAVIAFASAGAATPEGVGVAATVTLTVTGPGTGTPGLDQTITARVARAGGTAVGGPDPVGRNDFAAALPTDFAFAGDAGFVRTVPIAVYQNLTAQPDRTLTLGVGVLTDPTGGRAVVGAPAAFTLTITDDDSPNRTFNAPAAPVDYRLVRNGDFIDLYVNGTLAARDTFGTAPVVLNGSAGDDSLTVDFRGGDPLPDGVVVFNGGAGADRLLTLGGPLPAVTHNMVAAGGVGYHGNLDFAGVGFAAYAAVDLVDLTGSAITDLVFNLPQSQSDAVLEDDATAGNGASQLRSKNSSFVTTVFADPARSVTINSGAGVLDALTLAADGGDLTADLTAGRGNSPPLGTITVAAPVAARGDRQAAGTVWLEARTLAVNAAVSAKATLTLVASNPVGTGTAAQTAAGKLTAGQVQLGSSGASGTYTLTNPANDAATLLVDGAVSVSYVDANDLNVAARRLVDLRVTAGGGVVIADTAAGGTVSVTAGAALAAYDVAGGAGLSLAAGGFLRAIGALASSAGGVGLSAGGPLTIEDAASVTAAGTVTASGSSVAVTGAAAGGAGVTLTSATDLTVSGRLAAPGKGIAAKFGTAGAAVADLRGAAIDAATTTVTGGPGNDTLRFTGVGTPVTADGGAGTDAFEFDAEGNPVRAAADGFATSKAFVSYVNVESVGVLNPAAVTLTGGDGDDTAVIARAAGGPLRYALNGGLPVTVANPPAFGFDGGNGSDALVVDYANGSPVPAGGVAFDGGAGADRGLVVLGDRAAAVYLSDPAGPGLAGTVTVRGADAIRFRNLDAGSQVDVTNMMSLDVRFGAAGATATVNMGTAIAAAGGAAELVVASPTAAFAAVGAWNNGTLTIDTSAVAGDDTITLARADNAHGNTNLVVRTGTGADAVTAGGPVRVAGDLTVDTQAIGVTADLRAGGAIALTNRGTLALGAATVSAGGPFIQAGGGGVALTGAAVVAAARIAFAGTVDGPGGLTANTGGDTTFASAVGGTTPVGRLTTDPGGTTRVDGGLVRTSAEQAFNDAIVFSRGGTGFLATGGTIRFGTALDPATAGLDASVGGPGVGVTFAGAVGGTAAVGTLTVPDAADVGVAGGLTAAALAQSAGSGTTTLSGRPVVLTSGTGVRGGALNLSTRAVTFATDVDAKNAPVVLQLAAGAAQPSGRIVTPAFYLSGGGTFNLTAAGNDATNESDDAGGLFVNVGQGEVRFRDADDLFVRFADADAPAPAVVTKGGNVTLFAGGNFNADTTDTGFGTFLFDVAGTLRVFVGTDRGPDEPNAVRFVADARAIEVVLGTTDTATPDANVGQDTFAVRPLTGAPLTVNGNLPARPADQTTGPADTLLPQFGDVGGTSLATSNGGADGTFTFSDARFRPLSFTSIETIGGLQLEAFAVQTVPAAGTQRPEYAIRVRLTQRSPGVGAEVTVNGQINGAGLITNPFVVTPVLQAADQLFGPPTLASADVDGDGTPDLVIGNGPSNAPLVTVVSGERLRRAGSGQPLDLSKLGRADVLAQFYAYEPTFYGGVNVAAGDLDGDGKAEVVTGTGAGGGQRVRAFRVATGPGVDPYANAAPVYDFLAFDRNPAFRGGVNVAVGDVNDDGFADVAVGAGVGGGPRVTVYSGKTLAVLRDYFAYEPAFRGGVYVGVGRYDGDTKADVVTAPGPGGGPRVRVFDGAGLLGAVDDPTPAARTDFLAFDPVPSLVPGESGANRGVSGVAFGTSSDGSGGRRSVLVSTPRGVQTVIRRFDPAADLSIDPKRFTDLYEAFTGDNPLQAINPDPKFLRDGGAVAGAVTDL